MFSNLFISIVIIMFPILIYFIFSCYNILYNKVSQNIMLIVSLLTSLYFSLKYNNDNNIYLLLCNIPILVAYIRKEKHLALVLSLIMIISSYNIYSFSLYILMIKYLLVFLKPYE